MLDREEIDKLGEEMSEHDEWGVWSVDGCGEELGCWPWRSEQRPVVNKYKVTVTVVTDTEVQEITSQEEIVRHRKLGLWWFVHADAEWMQEDSKSLGRTMTTQPGSIEQDAWQQEEVVALCVQMTGFESE